MNRTLIFLCILTGCARDDGTIDLSYEEPYLNQYDAEQLRLYRTAYRAGWEYVIEEAQPEWLAPGANIFIELHHTVCEAKEPISKGYYDGVDYGNLFVHTLCETKGTLQAKRRYFITVQDYVKAHPTTNWYVPAWYVPEWKRRVQQKSTPNPLSPSAPWLGDL